MAAPRKKKRGPPFDVTGIDFSVITTALETGGKMIQQIIDGIHYGSPEVRLLMLEECDLIIECRVCRGLFRALPNFIAHKRVYCCQAYCNHSQNLQFQAATSFEPPQEQPVVVEPKAPEETDSKDDCVDSHSQVGQRKEKGRGEKKDGTTGGSKPAFRGDKSKDKSNSSQGKAKADSERVDSTRTGGSLQAKATVDPSQTKTQPQLKMGDKADLGPLAETVRQIQAGELGHSKAYAMYTAAAEKMEREKGDAENAAPLRLTAIPTNPCAVFVNSGNMTTSQTGAQSQSSALSQAAPSLQISADVGKVDEKNKIKNSSDSEPKVAGSQKSLSEGSMPASNGKTAAGGSAAQLTRKAVTAKGTLRNVARVVRELRQKKEESVLKKKAASKDAARRAGYKNTRSSSSLPSKPSSNLPLDPVLLLAAPAAQVSTSADQSAKWKEGKHHGVSMSVSEGVNPLVARTGDKGGSLRAVVKRCLTGRPGALRMSPHNAGSGERNSDLDNSLTRPGERSSDMDSISEAGSFSDRGEAPSPSGLLRQREEESPDQSAMDLDNMRCKICNMVFLRKKSLSYHCQTRHSGQRTIFPCPYCPRVFYYFWGLTRHLNTNHKKSPSDIDRMRKSLRRKAYKQDVSDSCASKRTPSMSPDDKDKDTAPRRSRPSVAARKVVAVCKSAPSSSSVEPNKTLPSVSPMAGRRRRVEVIASVHSKSKKPVDVYRKVYPSKQQALQVGSPKVVSPLSSPSRDRTRKTRRLVAKALRTTRSKRVYNRAGEESPPDTARAKMLTAERVHSKDRQSSLKNPPSKRSQQRQKPPQDTECRALADGGSPSVPSSLSGPCAPSQPGGHPDTTAEMIVSQKHPVDRSDSSVKAEKLMQQQPEEVRQGMLVPGCPAVEVDILAGSKPHHQETVLQNEIEQAQVGFSSNTLRLKAGVAADALPSSIESKTGGESKMSNESKTTSDSKVRSDTKMSNKSSVSTESKMSNKSSVSNESKVSKISNGSKAGDESKMSNESKISSESKMSSELTTNDEFKISSSGREPDEMQTSRPQTRTKTAAATSSLASTAQDGTTMSQPAPLTRAKSSTTSGLTLKAAGSASVSQPEKQTRTKTSAMASGSGLTTRSGTSFGLQNPQTRMKTPATPAGLAVSSAAAIQTVPQTPTTTTGAALTSSATSIQTAPQTHRKTTTATTSITLTESSNATVVQTAPQTRTKTPAITTSMTVTEPSSTTIIQTAPETCVKTSATATSISLTAPGSATIIQAAAQTQRKTTTGLTLTESSRTTVLQPTPQTRLTLKEPSSATITQTEPKTEMKTVTASAVGILTVPGTAAAIQTVQACAKTPAIATGLMLTEPFSSSQTAPQTRTKTSAQEISANVVKEASLVHVTRAKSSSSSPNPVASVDPPSPSSSGQLHICPHCQRVFGRKISLDSHVKICSKAKPTTPTSSPRKNDGSVRTGEGHSSQNKLAELGGRGPSTEGGNHTPERRVETRGDKSVTGRPFTARPDPQALDDKVSSARPGTRSLRDGPAGKSDLKPRSQQKSVTPQQNETAIISQDSRSKGLRKGGNDVTEDAGTSLRSSRNVSSKGSSSRESSVESRGTSKDSDTQAPSKNLGRRSRSRRDSKTSSSRDSSVDSVRVQSSDTKAAQPRPPDGRESRAKPRSAQDSSHGTQGRASSHDRTKPEENLLTISRQRLSEQLQAATTTKDIDSSEDVSNLRSVGRRTREKTESAKTTGKKSALERPPTQRTITTTVLRKTPKEKITDTAKKPSYAPRPGPAKKTEPLPEPTQEGTPKTDVQAVSVRVEQQSKPECPKTAKQPEPAQEKQQMAEGLTPKVQHIFPEGQLGNLKVDHQRVELSASKQQPQESKGLIQRPRRKRRAPAKILEREIECQESENGSHLTKKLRLDPGKLSNSSTSGTTHAAELHPAHCVSIEGEGVDHKDGNEGGEEERSKEEEKSVILVEEIWMEKKPGRPTERVKSNRIYVVEPARAGRLTCQDTRKVRQIVDERGLTCLQCKQQFTSVSNLRRHAIRHLGWRRYKCRLCCFCSYNRCECKTHILRTHPERLHSRVRVDTYITDLNRKAASVRSQKKRQTLDRCRREGEEGGGVRLASTGHRKALEVLKGEEKPTGGGDSSTSDGDTPSTAPKCSTSHGKSATPTSRDTQRSKQANPTTFNISTRNSPRKFDTRPYPPPDAVVTLNTRKGVYIKPIVSPFMQSLAQATSEGTKRVSSGAKEKQGGQIISDISDSAPEDKNAPSSSGHPAPTLHRHVEKVAEAEPLLSSPVVKADLNRQKNKEATNTDAVVPDLLESIDEEEHQKQADQGRGEERAGGGEEGDVAGKSQGGETGGFVSTKYQEDSDLMNVSMGDMQTLPEQFMSDDSQSPVNT